MTDYILPCILLLAALLALRKRENAYDILLGGAAEGMKLLASILPALILLLTAVSMEAADKAKSAQTGKMMIWLMPILSLWISFSIPVALSLYWFSQGIFSLVVDEYLTRKYRKIYDAEDAERLAKAMKEEQIEAEKELQRALKRAANPDGITQNTSKKKLQQQKQQAEEAAKAAAAKEYAAKKGIVEEEAPAETKTTLSGISDRPYCKGRAYDPNRYRNTTEE